MVVNFGVWWIGGGFVVDGLVEIYLIMFLCVD